MFILCRVGISLSNVLSTGRTSSTSGFGRGGVFGDHIKVESLLALESLETSISVNRKCKLKGGYMY